MKPCPLHPEYRALRPPRASCKYCRQIWTEQQDLLRRLTDRIAPILVREIASFMLEEALRKAHI